MLDINENNVKKGFGLMYVGMVVCCVVMLIFVVGFFIVGGMLVGLINNFVVFVFIVLCVGVYVVMFVFMGKFCYGNKKIK